MRYKDNEISVLASIKLNSQCCRPRINLGGYMRFILILSVAALYTPLGDVEEIFNPLGVSLGASES